MSRKCTHRTGRASPACVGIGRLPKKKLRTAWTSETSARCAPRGVKSKMTSSLRAAAWKEPAASSAKSWASRKRDMISSNSENWRPSSRLDAASSKMRSKSSLSGPARPIRLSSAASSTDVTCPSSFDSRIASKTSITRFGVKSKRLSSKFSRTSLRFPPSRAPRRRASNGESTEMLHQKSACWDPLSDASEGRGVPPVSGGKTAFDDTVRQAAATGEPTRRLAQRNTRLRSTMLKPKTQRSSLSRPARSSAVRTSSRTRRPKTATSQFGTSARKTPCAVSASTESGLLSVIASTSVLLPGLAPVLRVSCRSQRPGLSPASRGPRCSQRLGL
mmetsp:Transcript_40336/g.111095  ORF Transcript_40336/g.111095 Transcript_40336/m.111095 type:complete len:332 (-) Transcript_40336:120-1115(-)